MQFIFLWPKLYINSEQTHVQFFFAIIRDLENKHPIYSINAVKAVIIAKIKRILSYKR